MTRSTLTLNRAGTILGYGVLGVVGTAAVALAVLSVAQPVQPVIYDLFYLHVGPSEATETAVLTHVLVAGIAGLTVPLLVGDYLSDRGANLPALAWAVAALLGLVGLFLVVALAGLAAFLTALIILAIGGIGLPLLLRYRAGVRSGALPAFVGGLPVIILLLLLAGFGLGWGGGTVMTAQEVPAFAVNGSAAAFDDVPGVRDALLVAGDCSTATDGRRVCHMYLRSSAHELDAIRYMARHGVRCPSRTAQSGRSNAFIAAHDGMYYRITCSSYGD